MLMDLDEATRFAIHQLSEEKAKLVRDVIHHLGFVIKKYILSYALIMFITFLEIWLGLTVLGVTNASLVAAIIAVFDILPVVGASLIILPWAAVSLLTGNFGLAIGLIVLLAILAVVRNIIEPKIIGESLGIHPLLSLISMYIGLRLFGILGVLLAPAAVVAIRAFRAGSGASDLKDDNA
jgi:sporulation integral membrane protein YtvI